jgi:putative ABC transport system substrate-binding protein
VDRLNRRQVLRLGVSTAGLALVSGCGLPPFTAQPKVARIAWSWSGYAGGSTIQAEGFRAGLRDVGWIDGKNLVVDERHYGDHPERMSELAAELLASKPDILVGGLVPTLVFVRQTDSIPIVFAGLADPVGLGLIASYARPGGNVTGTSRTAADAGTLTGKQLDLLRQLLPGVARVAVAFNPVIPGAVSDVRDVQAVAQSLGIDAQAVPITALDEVEPALNAALARNPQALLVTAITPEHHPPIFRLAKQHGLPSAGWRHVCRLSVLLSARFACTLASRGCVPRRSHPAWRKTG